jgi:hypothetical protein
MLSMNFIAQTRGLDKHSVDFGGEDRRPGGFDLTLGPLLSVDSER